MNGKHGDYDTILEAINFAAEEDSEFITIGGGEPTLHPRFFDILERCLKRFDHVWFATNGSVTESMYRIHNIMQDQDYESFECTCTEEDLEYYECECDHQVIYSNSKLAVDISSDHYHDPIDERVVNLWKRMSKDNHNYNFRDVAHSGGGVSNQGRAARTGAGQGNHCVCSDIIIKPDGRLKMCGCHFSPIIGDIWRGISKEYDYHYNTCYREI
jgi:hypothetical protein